MSGVSPISSSSSLKRVRMVRRSWLTPDSMVVRCSICRSMRSRMSMKACAAWRTSRAPRGLKSATGRPLPNCSAASARCQDRLDLVAQEEERDADQHQRCADHPDQEDVRVGGVGAAARREDPQHVVASSAMRISTMSELPTVSIQKGRLISSRISRRKRRIEQREEGPRPLRGKRVGRQHRDGQPERVGGDARDVGEALILRIGLDDLDDGGDVARHRIGEPPRHQLPVALHEDVGDHRLEQDRSASRRSGWSARRGPWAGAAIKAGPRRRSSLQPARGKPQVRADLAEQGRAGNRALQSGRGLSPPAAGSRCRAWSAGGRGWRDPPRSCGAAG